MRRTAGNLLIAVSAIVMVPTVLWIVAGIAYSLRDLNEDQYTARVASGLLAGALFLLEAALLLAGRYLRQSSAGAGAAKAEPPGRRLHPWPLALYVSGSVAVALLAAFIHRAPEFLRPLWLVVGQPLLLVQVLLGGFLGIRFETGIVPHMVPVGFSLLYYLALFYPLCRLVTMDRTAEVVSYRRMKTLLLLFGGAHLLIAGAFGILIQA